MGNSRESSVGDAQGLVQSILNSENQGNPTLNFSRYYARPDLIGTANQPGLASLQNYLQGNYQRDLGQAARAGGAESAAYGGTNPYAFIEHAKANVGNQYANAFANLPLEAFKAQLGAFGQNADILTRLLGLKTGLAGQREGSPVGGILGGIGSLGSAYLGRPVTNNYSS